MFFSNKDYSGRRGGNTVVVGEVMKLVISRTEAEVGKPSE